MKNKTFTSNIILLVTICIMFVCLSFVTVLAIDEPDDAIIAEYSISNDVEYVETDDISYLNTLITDCQDKKLSAHNMAEHARSLGYSDESVIIVLAKNDWNNYNDLYLKYNDKYNSIQIAQANAVKEIKASEYPVATKVWNYLKEQGYNNYVCAGILGNMMVECGGGTLALNGEAYSPSKYYYGLCQWNKSAYKEVFGQDVDYQLNFLISNIANELNSFGKVYKAGFNYKSFLNLTNEQNVALAFAKCYERCGSGSYSARKTAATKAYNYFTN